MNATGVNASRERGSATVEASIGILSLIALFSFLLAAGRIMSATQAIEAAAFEAARTASIARTSTQAQTTAVASANASLDNQGIQCRSKQVHVDTTQFAKTIGAPAMVTATITCVVELADLTVPGMPGSRSVTAKATSPIDSYRGE